MNVNEKLRAAGVTPPALAEHRVGVRRTWLARARAGTLRPAPRGWAERLAGGGWVSVDEVEDLFDVLGVWPGESPVGLLTWSVPTVVAVRPKRQSDPEASLAAFPAASVALALVVLCRLGVPVPASELLTPLKRVLARRQLHAADELCVHRWRSPQERRVSVFSWPEDQETTDIPRGGRWVSQRLHDGRRAFSFRNTAGVPVEVIAHPRVLRDLDLALFLAGAPADLQRNFYLPDTACPQAPACPGATTEEVMASLRRLVSEVQLVDPTRPRRGAR